MRAQAKVEYLGAYEGLGKEANGEEAKPEGTEAAPASTATPTPTPTPEGEPAAAK